MVTTRLHFTEVNRPKKSSLLKVAQLSSRVLAGCSEALSSTNLAQERSGTLSTKVYKTLNRTEMKKMKKSVTESTDMRSQGKGCAAGKAARDLEG